MSGKRDLKDGFIRADGPFEENMQRMLLKYRGRGEARAVRPLRLVLVSVLSTLLICAAALSFAGQTGALDFLFAPRQDLQFTYVTSYKNGVKGFIITGYYGQEGNVVIPERIERVPVTGIGAGAFARSMKLTSVTLPQGLITIGDNAFYQCENLAGIAFGGGAKLQSIGNSAFADCVSLTSLSVPEGVKTVGDLAFASCSGLVSVTLPEGLEGLGEGAFSDCEKLPNVKLPGGIRQVRGGLFAGCLGLMSVTLPDSIEAIGANAFYECRSLNSIALPDGLTQIPDYAFWRCESLREIRIPQSVAGIGDFAFSWCAGLEKAALPEGVTRLGMQAFAWCLSLESLDLPESLAQIGEGAFSFCDLLTLRAAEGSYAQRYAQEQGIPFAIVHD